MGSLFTSANSYVEVEEAVVFFPRGTKAPGSFWTIWGRGCPICVNTYIYGAKGGRSPKRNGVRTDTQEEGE